MSSGGLTFLSWVRTGLVSALDTAAGDSGSPLDATLPQVATLPVTLGFADSDPGVFNVNLAGPGDVTGLDARQVIRCEPSPNATNVEPNYFPFIEFDRPDLPWLFTPGAPAEATPEGSDPRRGLRPWLCLVVVPDASLAPATSRRPLPSLVVPASELPDLETAWLWAHAQVLAPPGVEVKTVLKAQPDLTLSRLIAPRRLLPGVSYLACVVPAFEAGRRAGLGLEPRQGTPLAPAWTHGAGPRSVELPVYHSWRFATAREPGDFESLARRLHSARFGRGGVRPLDVGHAGAALPGPAAGEAPWLLDLEGVILGDQISIGGWPDARSRGLQEAIALRLAASDQELAPPTYGNLHAAYRGTLASGAGPRWLRDLNLDPRYRATAALGTRIVQRHQEALMASAWEQTAAIREANRLLRQAQLARTVGQVLYQRIQGPGGLAADHLLQLTAAVHGQIAGALRGSTVATTLAPNAAVRSTLSLAFRRAARPTGALARRLVAGSLPAPVQRLALPAEAADALRPTSELRPVGGTTDLSKLSAPGGQETLKALTRERVLAPVFPWEVASLPSSRPKVPFAYLADLVVTTLTRPDYGYQTPQAVVAVAKALHFDGVPQLGWEQLESYPVSAIGFGDWNHSSASTYVDRDDVRGVLSLQVQTWYANVNAFSASLQWKPGFLLESTAAPLPGQATPVQGELPRGLAITTADLTGTGQIDVVVCWSDESVWSTGPSMSQRFTKSFVAIGRNLDPNSGAIQDGWVTGRELSGQSGYSIAAIGNRLFLLRGNTLVMETLSPTGTVTASKHLELASRLPEDFVKGAIIAADFGGATGADLLIYFVAGTGQARRSGYRIAFDIDVTGQVGAWGDIQQVPVPVAGTEIGLLLGASRASTEARRSQMTGAFRQAAADTQARQERIAQICAAPAPAPAVAAAAMAADVAGAIDPLRTVPATVESRLALANPVAAGTVSDPLQPMSMTPRFPYPTFELFRDAFQERLYPGSGELPDNTVTAMVVNRNALEAFLVGLNHEMSRELLWRGFPLCHGTYFSRFWQGERDDISAIDEWDATTPLGHHAPAGMPQASLLLVVRGELLRRIPDVTVYAVPAQPGRNGSGRSPDLSRRVEPLFSGRLQPDLRFFGFPLTAAEARGSGPEDGHYFIFQEHPMARRFGLDQADDGWGTRPATWADVTWPQMAVTASDYASLTYIQADATSPLAGVTLPDGGSSTLVHRWGFSAAHMAHITLQRPVLIARHGSDLIDPGVSL